MLPDFHHCATAGSNSKAPFWQASLPFHGPALVAKPTLAPLSSAIVLSDVSAERLLSIRVVLPLAGTNDKRLMPKL